MNGLLLIAALSLPAQTELASEAPWQGSLSLGVGHEWAAFGVRGEVLYKSFSASASIGSWGPLAVPSLNFAIGVRWYPLGLGRHSLFLGPHASASLFPAERFRPFLYAVAVTAGYRFQLEHVFFEVSGGPAVAWFDAGFGERPRFEFSPGALGQGGWYIPDVGLAVGWRF